MIDDAAMVLEEIAPEDKTCNEVLEARVNLYLAAKKWDMAASVASHLVKVEPKEAGWWINLAYATRRGRRGAYRRRFATVSYRLACCRSSRQRTTSLEHSRRVVSATLELSCFQETFRRVNTTAVA